MVVSAVSFLLLKGGLVLVSGLVFLCVVCFVVGWWFDLCGWLGWGVWYQAPCRGAIVGQGLGAGFWFPPRFTNFCCLWVAVTRLF